MAIPVIMPRQGQSVETCIIGAWYNKKGDHVTAGEIIMSYETDKASFDLESPATGEILEIFYKSGDEVKVLTNIAVIGQPGESIDSFVPGNTSSGFAAILVSEASDQLSDVQKTTEQIISTGDRTDKVKISPRARNLASRLNIDVSKVNGTGPMGKILEKDIEDAAASGLQSGWHGEESTKGDLLIEEILDKQGYTIKKISNIRKIIAENMHSSLRNSAQLTHHTSANAKKILEYRKIFKSDPEKAKGENITINDMVCYAVMKALKIKPEINSHFLDDSIKTFSQVHLGIAVDTERGLMVPVLKNADDYSLPELSRGLKSLADRCRKGNIDPELLAGEAASFTVSNLGFYGIEMFTPVLYMPQTGILGINAIITRPDVLSDGTIGSVPVIGLSLTYDHRAIDGAPASAFLKEVKDQIEMFDPGEV